MTSEEMLRRILRNADGKPLSKYGNIKGSFATEDFEIVFDRIQSDRFGRTDARVRVSMRKAGFPEELRTPARIVALRDIIARRFWESSRIHARTSVENADGGQVIIPRPGQEILSRGSVNVTEYCVEVRFGTVLPTRNGKVSEAAAVELIFGRIRSIVSESMFYSAYKERKILNFAETAENADWIRGHLSEKGLVAFVAVGSVLPRREDGLAPLAGAVPFDCEDSLKVTMEVPNGESIVGMGIRKGFTVLAGNPESGRSVLAESVFAGIWNHIPGDGREYVVSVPDATYVRTEPGRFSDGKITTPTESEYVSLKEAVALGSRLIIADEDTSRQSFLRRGYGSGSEGMSLSEIGHSMGDSGVSVLMVSGDRDVAAFADSILVTDGFGVRTSDAVGSEGRGFEWERKEYFPIAKNVAFRKFGNETGTSAPELRKVRVGEAEIEIPSAGFFDLCQTKAVALAIALVLESMDGSVPLMKLCGEALVRIDQADTAEFRPIDMASVLLRHPQMIFVKKDRRRLLP